MTAALASDDRELADEAIPEECSTRPVRVGLIGRLAREVKHEMGGVAPSHTHANVLVVTRKIDELLVGYKVVRRSDRAHVAARIRALVFTRGLDESEEAEWLNTQAARDAHVAPSKWGGYEWSWLTRRWTRRAASADA